MSFSPDGGAGVARIATNRECQWSAQSDASWITVMAPSTGQGDGSVNFRVAANGDPPSRAAGIVVEGQRLQISQSGRPCTFALSSVLEMIPAVGGERTVEVAASSPQCRWSAAVDVPWIAISSAPESSGTGAVTFRVNAWTGVPRTGSVTIAGTVVRVEQGVEPGPGPTPGPSPTPGCTYTLGAQLIEFESNGGVREVILDTAAACSWSASVSAEWVAVIGGQSGSGPGAVRVRAVGNTGAPRNAVLRVADRNVTIVQASGCSVALSPGSATVDAGASTGVVQVSAGEGCVWSAASDAGWIAIAEGANGSGSGQVRFSIAANPGPARQGSIAVGGRAFAIAQASGCAYSISPSTQDVSGGGGAGAVSISTAAGCSWAVSSNADWIAVAPQSGSGPAQITYTVSPNRGPVRSGTLVVAGQTFTVSQASPCTWAFVPPFHTYDAGGGAGAILVIPTGPCEWTAVSNVSWISVTSGASGTGGGLVQFVVAPNTGAPRNGSLTIAGQRYEVGQGGR